MQIYKAVRHASLDIWLLWASVFLRMFSFGITNQVLVLFLREVEIPQSQIGYFMTMTLIGDVLISFFLSWNADRIGRRVVLVVGTLMMFVSGAVFCTQSDFLVLLLAAIFGVISPSGDETGPFKTIEEASLAHLTIPNHRPEVFAFHSMFSAVGTALGSLVSGVVIDYLNLTLSWDIVSCYRAIFVLYSAISVIKFFIMISLSEKCELQSKSGYDSDTADENTPLNEQESSDEADTLVNENTENNTAHISATAGTTASVASKLLVVFFLDSLGYGFMPASWIVYYFKSTYRISATILGSLFFCTSVVDTVTTIPSAILAKLFGPVKAILMTQVPSSIFFIAIAFCDNFLVSAVLLVVYFATTAMDVVPRQILIISVVKKEAFTKVLGSVNIVKTFARCIGPLFTGRFSGDGRLYICFIISGCFTLLCDAVLGYNFLSLDKMILEQQRTR